MSIRFDCQACGKDLVVHDRLEGRSVRCPSCDTNVSVPNKRQIEEARRQALEKERDQQRQAQVVARPIPSMSEEVVEVIEVDGESDRSMATAMAVSDPSTPPPQVPKRKRRAIKEDHGDEEEDLEWDITPMVDVAFLLLIFFMLTASFSIQKVIRTAPQKSDQPSSSPVTQTPETPQETIVLQVDEFNTYTVITPDQSSQEASSRQELLIALKEIRMQYGDEPPRINIQAHEDSMHGAVVAAMDAAREADFTKFQIFAVENFD